MGELTEWQWENEQEARAAVKALNGAVEALTLMEWYEKSSEMVRALTGLVLEVEKEVESL